MSMIGTMKKLEDGAFSGKIKTMMLDVNLSLQPNDRKEDNDGRPDYIARANGYEAGGAWEKTAKNGNTYWSLRLDDPVLSAPLQANLTKTEEGKYLIFWDR